MCLILRPVKESDCDLLFEWVNDGEVRQRSFKTDSVLYDDHKKWFNKKLCSNLNYIFIICVDEKLVGQIRIDIENNEGIIDYSVDKNYRGQGYGSKALEKIICVIKEQEIKVDKLIGKVKFDNLKSRKAFERAGYKSVDRQDYIEYYQEL